MHHNVLAVLRRLVAVSGLAGLNSLSAGGLPPMVRGIQPQSLVPPHVASELSTTTLPLAAASVAAASAAAL